MFIEMIGPPGVGKTSLLPTVIEALREMGIQAYTVVDAARPYAQRTFVGRVLKRLTIPRLHQQLFWQYFSLLSFLYRIKFIANNPSLVWQVIKTQSRRPSEADVRQRKVQHWFFRLIGYYEFLRTNIKPNEVVILDEGFLHRVVQLFSSSIEEPIRDQIFGYVDLLPPPDLTVFIQASPDVCEKRIYERGLWERLQHRNQDEISHFVDNAHLAVTLAVSHARRKGWTIIEVDNEESDLKLAQVALRYQVAKYFGKPFAPPISG
jgi:thymidylate kinase